MTQKQRDMYNKTRENARDFLIAADALVKAQIEWNVWNYGSTLPDEDLNNAGLTKDDIGPALFEVGEAIAAILDASGQGKRKILTKLI